MTEILQIIYFLTCLLLMFSLPPERQQIEMLEQQENRGDHEENNDSRR